MIDQVLGATERMATIRAVGIGITLCALVLACSIPIAPPTKTSSRNADVGRVLEHLRQLDDHASAMMKTASLGAVANPHAARVDFTLMVETAQTDFAWLPSADLPDALRAPYKRLLSNILLNAGKLNDGSKDAYFVFLGSRLAPLWRKDLDVVRSIANGLGP
jgi:hypothetical protein